MDFFSIISAIDSFLWGPPLIILLVGTGIYLTLRLKLLQVAKLPLAMKLILSAKNKGDGDISSFKALCLALSATVGTGNIVGVATAVEVGGPGAIFWSLSGSVLSSLSISALSDSASSSLSVGSSELAIRSSMLPSSSSENRRFKRRFPRFDFTFAVAGVQPLPSLMTPMN